MTPDERQEIGDASRRIGLLIHLLRTAQLSERQMLCDFVTQENEKIQSVLKRSANNSKDQFLMNY